MTIISDRCWPFYHHFITILSPFSYLAGKKKAWLPSRHSVGHQISNRVTTLCAGPPSNINLRDHESPQYQKERLGVYSSVIY